MASGGNLGKASEYPEIWGAINSPANDPSVITVYPMKTGGTATHRDDIATTYGSRGPTYLDGLFKPDLAAPGNKIPSLLASGSNISQGQPELQIDEYYITLSGSSMATPFVTGTIALMLEANPDLNPNIAKLILLSSAIKLQQPHALEQGNGLVNAFTAVRLAEAIDMETHQLTSAVSPQWFLDGETVRAGGAFVYGDQVVLSPWQKEADLEASGSSSSDAILWGGRHPLGGRHSLGRRHSLGECHPLGGRHSLGGCHPLG